MATIRARVSRTIQVRQYEPLTVELEAVTDTKSISAEDLAKELDELEGALEDQVDAIMAYRIKHGK
jgi:hypothetical protein